MMLTREQLQTAARYLCKIRNIDPDQRVLMTSFPARDFGFLCDAWENVADEIEAHERLSEAIQYARQTG